MRPDDTELQVAGLVHDIGHQFASDEQHGVLGAERSGRLLGDRVAALVEMHVPAKRYLVATDPDYRSALTEGSIVRSGCREAPCRPRKRTRSRRLPVCGRRRAPAEGGRRRQGAGSIGPAARRTGCRC